MFRPLPVFVHWSSPTSCLAIDGIVGSILVWHVSWSTADAANTSGVVKTEKRSNSIWTNVNDRVRVADFLQISEKKLIQISISTDLNNGHIWVTVFSDAGYQPNEKVVWFKIWKTEEKIILINASVPELVNVTCNNLQSIVELTPTWESTCKSFAQVTLTGWLSYDYSSVIVVFYVFYNIDYTKYTIKL